MLARVRLSYAGAVALFAALCVLLWTGYLSFLLAIVGGVVAVLIFWHASHRLVAVTPAVLAVLPYLTAVMPHVQFVTPTRVFLLASLLVLRQLPRSDTDDARLRWLLAVRRWAWVYLLVVLVLTAPHGLTSAGVGQAVDLALLPYLYLVTLLPRAGSLTRRTATVTAVVASGVLVFEVLAGWYEFTSGSRLLNVKQQSVVAYTGVDPSQGVRALGTFLTTESYSLFCALLGLYLTGYWVRRGHSAFALLLACAALAGGVFSGTRDTLLFYVPLAVYVYLRAGRSTLTRTVWGVVLTVPALAIVNVLFHPFSNDALAGRVSNQGNIDSRFAAFRAAWQIFIDRPLFGVGFGRYNMVATADRYQFYFHGVPSVPYPHNTYLSVLAETGIVGGVVFGLLWAAVLRALRGRSVSTVMVPVALMLLLDSLADNQGQEVPSLVATVFLVGVGAFAAVASTERPDRGVGRRPVPRPARPTRPGRVPATARR